MMDRPHIRLGCFAPLLLVALWPVCFGCVDQGGVVTPKKPKAATLGQIAFDSFQNRDRVRAEKLRALKGTKYDAKRIAAIEEAGREASEETWKPVAEALAKVLDRVPQDDQAAFDRVLEELAKAAENAGK